MRNFTVHFRSQPLESIRFRADNVEHVEGCFYFRTNRRAVNIVPISEVLYVQSEEVAVQEKGSEN